MAKITRYDGNLLPFAQKWNPFLEKLIKAMI